MPGSAVTPGPDPEPTIPAALRLALSDMYFHSIRLVPANLAWGLGCAAVLGLTAAGQPLAAAVVAVLLAVPLVAIARLAGVVVRGGDVVLSDGWMAARQLAGPAIVAGAAILVTTVVLVTNIGVGLAAGSVPALVVGVLAAWGLVALWLVALPFWILLADPRRAGRGTVRAAREAGMVLLVRPRRMLALAVTSTVILVIGTVLVAAILTVAVAYAALVTARVVLPAADRLAGASELASIDRP